MLFFESYNSARRGGRNRVTKLDRYSSPRRVDIQIYPSHKVSTLRGETEVKQSFYPITSLQDEASSIISLSNDKDLKTS